MEMQKEIEPREVELQKKMKEYDKRKFEAGYQIGEAISLFFEINKERLYYSPDAMFEAGHQIGLAISLFLKQNAEQNAEQCSPSAQ